MIPVVSKIPVPVPIAPRKSAQAAKVPMKIPDRMAAGVIYIAGILCGDRMPLDAVAGVAKVSSSTVSKYYMKLARGLGFQER